MIRVKLFDPAWAGCSSDLCFLNRFHGFEGVMPENSRDQPLVDRHEGKVVVCWQINERECKVFISSNSSQAELFNKQLSKFKFVATIKMLASNNC